MLAEAADKSPNPRLAGGWQAGRQANGLGSPLSWTDRPLLSHSFVRAADGPSVGLGRRWLVGRLVGWLVCRKVFIPSQIRRVSPPVFFSPTRTTDGATPSLSATPPADELNCGPVFRGKETLHRSTD